MTAGIAAYQAELPVSDDPTMPMPRPSKKHTNNKMRRVVRLAVERRGMMVCSCQRLNDLIDLGLRGCGCRRRDERPLPLSAIPATLVVAYRVETRPRAKAGS